MIIPADPLIEALLAGRSFTWTMPDGGDFASMRRAIRHGQTLTMSPVVDAGEIQVGDIVCLKWHKGTMTHLVQEIQGDQFLIANSLGKINGWVSGRDILGRVTQIIDPEARPEVPEMLAQLEAAYSRIIERGQPGEESAHRLMCVVDDLRWYAARINAERWDKLPRQNRWSFAQRLWRLTRQARSAAAAEALKPIEFMIDQGKQEVGLAAEAYALFEYGETAEES